MSRQIDFTVTVEIEDDQDVSLSELISVLSELEDVCANNNYGLYDAQICEDGECLTDEYNQSDSVDDNKEQSDFAQDDGYDGILDEG